MRRKLFTFAAVESVVLCIGTALLWMRSFWVGDRIYQDNYFVKSGVVWRRSWICESSAGGLGVWFSAYSDADPHLNVAATVPLGVARRWYVDWNPAGPPHNVPLWFRRPGPIAGFGLATYPYTAAGYHSHREWSIILPHWFLLAASALLPAWWFPRQWRAAQRRQRAAQGACPHCGYDLTANTSGVCPECGTPVAGKAG